MSFGRDSWWYAPGSRSAVLRALYSLPLCNNTKKLVASYDCPRNHSAWDVVELLRRALNSGPGAPHFFLEPWDYFNELSKLGCMEHVGIMRSTGGIVICGDLGGFQGVYVIRARILLPGKTVVCLPGEGAIMSDLEWLTCAPSQMGPRRHR